MSAAIDQTGRHAWGLTRLQAAQRRELLCVLIETDGNQSAACESLGISRPTCRQWMKQYHIHQSEWEHARATWHITGTQPGQIQWNLYPAIAK